MGGRFRASRRALLLVIALALSTAQPIDGRTLSATPAVVMTVSALAVHLRSGAAADALRVPAEVRWDATPMSPGMTFRVQRRIDGGAWTSVAMPDPTRTRVAVTMAAWRVHEFRVAPVDAAGERGAWSVTPRLRARHAMEVEPIGSFAGTWQRKTGAAWLEGSSRIAKSPDASARFQVRALGVAWVATKGPDRGRPVIAVDGTTLGTVDLRAAAVTYRRVVWARTWATAETRTIEVRAGGGATPMDVDGLLILEQPTRDPVLVGAGDIASCTSSGDEATASILDGIEGTVFTAGDNVYRDGTASEFKNCYGPSWGRHRERTRPVPGNHDYHTARAAGYKGYFGSAATPRGTTWYAYDLGAWRVYALDSECLAIGGCGASSAQGRWLVTDLARHPRRCVAAIWHVPLFSSGEHGNDRTMAWTWRTLDAAGADVVIAGHEHDYERFSRQNADGTPTTAGMREFIVGTGGIKLRAFGRRVRNSVVRWNGSHGILALTLRPASYSWRFVPVPGSSFRDAGSTACA